MTDTLTPTEDAMEAVQAETVDLDAAARTQNYDGYSDARTNADPKVLAKIDRLAGHFARHRVAHTQAPPREPSGAMVEPAAGIAPCCEPGGSCEKPLVWHINNLIENAYRAGRKDEHEGRDVDLCGLTVSELDLAALTAPGPATAVGDAQTYRYWDNRQQRLVDVPVAAVGDARELLAAELEADKRHSAAKRVRDGLMDEEGDYAPALRAIKRALSRQPALSTEAGAVIELLRARKDEAFDGECHLTNEEADRIIEQLAASRSGELREALAEAREAIVLTLAFYGRDQGTPRIDHTMEEVCDMLAKADGIARAALANTVPARSYGEAAARVEQWLANLAITKADPIAGDYFSPESIEIIEQAVRPLLNAFTGTQADVVRLVIAARKVAFEDQSPEAIRELDQASEAFAEQVPWDDEPDAALNTPHSQA